MYNINRIFKLFLVQVSLNLLLTTLSQNHQNEKMLSIYKQFFKNAMITKDFISLLHNSTVLLKDDFFNKTTQIFQFLLN